MTYRAVDCQGFAGGFTLGTVQAGFELVGKREMAGGFGVPNCEANRHLLGDGWKSQACDPEEWEPEDAEYVFGNPPCSGFSLMSAKGFRGIDSKINSCMHSFVEYVARVGPQIAVFESVQQAYSTGRPLMQALRDKLEALTGERWDLVHVLHNALSVGGSSMRRRYFWTVAREGQPWGLETPQLRRVPTLNEVIGDLEGHGITWERQPYRRAPSWWAKPLRSSSGAFDGHMSRDTPYLRRSLELAHGVDGEWGPRETISSIARRYVQRHGTLPDSWARQRDKLMATDFEMGFNQLIRWDGERISRVITGGGCDLVVHPNELRTLTHREVARIMGFPDDWVIRPLRGVGGLQLTWGKGIITHCGRWISELVYRALDGNAAEERGDLIGEREWRYDCTHAYKTAEGPKR